MSFVIFLLAISVIINYIQVTLLLFKGAISVLNHSYQRYLHTLLTTYVLTVYFVHACI